MSSSVLWAIDVGAPRVTTYLHTCAKKIIDVNTILVQKHLIHYSAEINHVIVVMLSVWYIHFKLVFSPRRNIYYSCAVDCVPGTSLNKE